MGLFSKKPKTISYDPQISNENKSKLRALFNDAVEDGDTYQILYGTSSSSHVEKGFVLDTRVTTFYSYIMGWREADSRVVFVQINTELTQHADAFYITINQVKETSYNIKLNQIWFIYKEGPDYGMGLKIGDRSSTVYAGLSNLYQEPEREAFLDFFEKYTDKLLQTGFKFKKWKRQ